MLLNELDTLVMSQFKIIGLDQELIMYRRNTKLDL